MNPTATASDLCLACGLCCDGTLFSKVRLNPDDAIEPLRTEGLPVSLGGEPEFVQPCTALQSDCRCRVYVVRPSQCRKFECRLLQAVANAERSQTDALALIQATRAQARLVRRLLRSLDQNREDQALSLRYQETERRFRAGELSKEEDRDETAAAFAELTLAVYRLQAMLRQDFYA
jgi:uncharacterized protein